MGRKKKVTLNRQLKFNISDELYQRGMADKDLGYYADKYESEFWTYMIWLGTNCYESEIIDVELRNEKAPKISGLDRRIGELNSQAAGE